MMSANEIADHLLIPAAKLADPLRVVLQDGVPPGKVPEELRRRFPRGRVYAYEATGKELWQTGRWKVHENTVQMGVADGTGDVQSVQSVVWRIFERVERKG